MSSRKMSSGKDKGKASAREGSDRKGLRQEADGIVNEGVAIQDSASSLDRGAMESSLQVAASKYRDALELVPGHAEASYNLATCLSEQADLLELEGDIPGRQIQIALMTEARTLLAEVIARDTSRRGETTALAHHATGNLLRSFAEFYRRHCPDTACPVGCPSLQDILEGLRQACQHFEAAVFIQQHLGASIANTGEVLTHWGDAEAR
ncbi:unnamed protein product [Choristocarpus tenellus]